MFLIVGLGNPGKQYASTRHNIGWRILDALKSQLDPDSEWKDETKFSSLVCRIKNSNNSPPPAKEEGLGEEVNLAKPLTFMNLSGFAVQKLINFYKIDPAKDLLIIHDDKDLLFGTMKLENGRSSAGQKGVQNIIDCLGTKEFLRLRFGVGQKTQTLPTDAFILKPFSPEEEHQLPALIQKTTSLLLSLREVSQQRDDEAISQA